MKLDKGEVDIQSKTYLIPQRIMLGTGQQVRCYTYMTGQWGLIDVGRNEVDLN